MMTKQFTETLKALADTHLSMMKQNNVLLSENINLWKEVTELRRQVSKYE